jgi:hypothetical protein
MEQDGNNLTHKIPEQRLLNFFVHVKNTVLCIFEQVASKILHMSGWILPVAANTDGNKDVQCVNFGPVEGWWIMDYEEGSPTIAFRTSLAEYYCRNLAFSYRHVFKLLLENATLCIQVYKKLFMLDGGDLQLRLEQLNHRLSMYFSEEGCSREFYSYKYLLINCPFIASKLKALDQNATKNN